MDKLSLSTTGYENEYTNWWMEKQKESRDEYIEIGGMRLFVSHDVFSPKPDNTNSVDLILRNFPDVKGKRVLDIGTGIGVLAIKAARDGAKEVVATDVTEVALKNAMRNVESTKMTGIVKITDQERFEDLEGSFDVIIMNIIFAHSPEDVKTKEKVRVESLGLHRRLIDALPTLLSPDGVVVLGFASFGDIDALIGILNDGSLDVRIVSEEKFRVNWYVIEIWRR